MASLLAEAMKQRRINITTSKHNSTSSIIPVVFDHINGHVVSSITIVFLKISCNRLYTIRTKCMHKMITNYCVLCGIALVCVSPNRTPLLSICRRRTGQLSRMGLNKTILSYNNYLFICS